MDDKYIIKLIKKDNSSEPLYASKFKYGDIDVYGYVKNKNEALIFDSLNDAIRTLENHDELNYNQYALRIDIVRLSEEE